MYIDVPISTDLIRDGMKALTVVPATCNKKFTGAAVTFSIDEDGLYTLDGVALATPFAEGDQIIIRGSVQAAVGEAPAVDNDGVYTILTKTSTTTLTVDKPVSVAVSETTITVDEIDTFILHPTKRIEQICVFVINSAATDPEISFVPGDFWAASTKKGIPLIQGKPLGATSNLFQVESAKYLQDKEEELIAEVDPITEPAVMRKGTILMRLIPAAAASGATVSVGLIQLY